MKKTVGFFILFCCLIWAAPINGHAALEDLMAAAGIQKFNQDLKSPGIQLKDFSGRSIGPGDYKGRVVFLFFYATW